MFTISPEDCTQMNQIILRSNMLEAQTEFRLTFLNDLQHLISFDSASFYLAEDYSFKIKEPVYINFKDSIIDLYNNYFVDKDYVIPFLCSEKPYIYRLTDVIVKEYYDSNEVINGFMAPQNLRFTEGMNLIWNNQFLGIVVLFRRYDVIDFTAKELFLLSQLQNHISYKLYNILNKSGNNQEIKKSNYKSALMQYRLSTREIEIINLLVKGYSNQDISDSMFISINTVKSHLRNILRKLNVTNRQQILSRFVDV